jgi:hypothetical protein
MKAVIQIHSKVCIDTENLTDFLELFEKATPVETAPVASSCAYKAVKTGAYNKLMSIDLYDDESIDYSKED